MLHSTCENLGGFKNFWKFPPDYNWVMCKCKVSWGFFIFRGTVNSCMNYWQPLGGIGFPILRSRGPEEGKRFFANCFMVSNPESRWLQGFFEFSPQKLSERCDLTL